MYVYTCVHVSGPWYPSTALFYTASSSPSLPVQKPHWETKEKKSNTDLDNEKMPLGILYSQNNILLEHTNR